MNTPMQHTVDSPWDKDGGRDSSAQEANSSGLSDTTRLLKSIKNGQSKSFIIEFLGLPGAGKSTFNDTLLQEWEGLFEHFTTEDIPCDSRETPYTFSAKVITQLNRLVQSTLFNRPLLMERGILDEEIWLSVHKKLGNLNALQYTELRSQMPPIPDKIDYYVFLFDVDIAESQRRRIAERRIPDTWGLNKETLKALYEEYQKLTDSTAVKKMIKIDALRSKEEVYTQVKREIRSIVQQHLNY